MSVRIKTWSSYAREVIGTGHEKLIILSYPFLNGSAPKMLGECRYTWKTAPWDLGPVLQCLPLDTPLLEQQNTKMWDKNDGAWAVRANSGQKVETKNQQLLLMSSEQKQGAAQALCTGHNLRGGQTTYPPPASRLDTPSLSPEGASLPCLHLLPVFVLHSCGRDSSKTLPDFLIWHLINFYWFRRARRACLVAPW